MHGQGQKREQKHRTKNFVEFHNHSPLLTMPQSNGEVERAMQTIVNLLMKGQYPYKALLNYRNTPLDGIGLSLKLKF